MKQSLLIDDLNIKDRQSERIGELMLKKDDSYSYA